MSKPIIALGIDKPILSLDLSTKSTGWAVALDGQYVTSGCIACSPTMPTIERIHYMREQISTIAKKYGIQVIVAEEVPPIEKDRNIHTQKVLSWLQADIVFMAYEISPSISFEFMQSSEWRKKIGIKTGRGIKRDALKQADMDYVLNHYDIKANDDECDAICLLDAYLCDFQII